MPRRWWLLALFLPVYTAVMAWVATFLCLILASLPEDWDDLVEVMVSPEEWIDALTEEWWWGSVGVPVVVLVVTQALFIAPLCSPRLRRSEHGTPLRFSVAVAGVVAAALTLGLGFAAWNLVQFVAFQLGRSPYLDFEIEVPHFASRWWMLYGVVAVSWVFWSFVLLAFAKRNPRRWVGTRLIGLLLGGTIAEVIVVLPLDIIVRRNQDCYCATGTFYALCLSGWALLWLAGPGAIIAVLSKRRRLWFDTHCDSCGYEKGPTPGERCPECGFAWVAKSRTDA